MEKEAKKAKEPDFVLQWGNRKRHRCVKVKSKDHTTSTTATSTSNINGNNLGAKLSSDSVGKKKFGATLVSTKKDSFSHSPQRSLNKSSEQTPNRRKTLHHSPEKDDRIYTMRGSFVAEENGKLLLDHGMKKEKEPVVWPRLFLSLSCKEKEEDFMAIKGCKPPQRPKKRAKLIQRSVLLACPGTWLSDVSQERYEVREKKASKKKPRGLKAMGSMESESE